MSVEKLYVFIDPDEPGQSGQVLRFMGSEPSAARWQDGEGGPEGGSGYSGYSGVSGCPTGTLDYFHTYQTVANSATVGVATWLQRHDVTRDSMTATLATITAGVDLVSIIEGRYLCTANGTFAARVASELANNDLVIQIGSHGYFF